MNTDDNDYFNTLTNHTISFIEQSELTVRDANKIDIKTINITPVVAFEDLTINSHPIIPLPEYFIDYKYGVNFDGDCIICNAPENIRKTLEHTYLSDPSRKPKNTSDFFTRHYGAKISSVTIHKHMTKHCILNNIYKSGLEIYKATQDSTMLWKYRELDLALNAVITELDEIKGYSIRTFDEKQKQTTLINNLTNTLMKIKKERDEKIASLDINVFEVLQELLMIFIEKQYNLNKPEQVVMEKIVQLREKLFGE